MNTSSKSKSIRSSSSRVDYYSVNNEPSAGILCAIHIFLLLATSLVLFFTYFSISSSVGDWNRVVAQLDLLELGVVAVCIGTVITLYRWMASKKYRLVRKFCDLLLGILLGLFGLMTLTIIACLVPVIIESFIIVGFGASVSLVILLLLIVILSSFVIFIICERRFAIGIHLVLIACFAALVVELLVNHGNTPFWGPLIVMAILPSFVMYDIFSRGRRYVSIGILIMLVGLSSTIIHSVYTLRYM